MDYSTRIKYAALSSFGIHVAALFAGSYNYAPDVIGTTNKRNPLVVRLQPDQPERVLRVIDAGAPTDVAPENPDLVSDRNSRAQDLSDESGDSSRPAVERVDDFDDLGRPGDPQAAQAANVTPPVRTARARPQTSAKPRVDPQPQSEANAPRLQTRGATPARSAEVPDLEPMKEAAPKAAEAETTNPPQPDQPAQRFEMAQAEATLPTPVQDIRATRGREGGGADQDGFTSFEATQHELGAYMLELRRHVEREWRMSLQLRYSGVSPTYAVLHCEIQPDGRLAGVEILDAGGSPGYATMCKGAIQRASAQFTPFPFDIPDIYRNKNLEVRWRFSYM